jgi:hypothetical protein
MARPIPVMATFDETGIGNATEAPKVVAEGKAFRHGSEV